MRPSRVVRLLSLAGATSILAAGCSSGGGSTQPRSLQLGLDTTSLTVQPGSSAHLTVTVERVAFSGDVTVSVLGLPSSVSADPIDIPAGQDSGTVTLVADASAQPAAVEVTIQATAGGTTTTAPLALVIGQDASRAFSFTVGTDSVTIRPAIPDSLRVLITRAAGFAGAVRFEAVGLPAGMTALFTPDTVAGDTAQLVLTADPTVPLDSAFALTLTGWAAGVGVVSTTLYTTVSTSLPAGFVLQPAFTSFNMYPGEADTFNLMIKRTGGYTGAVSLSFTEVPAGLSVSVTPARAVGDSAAIAVSAGATLALDSTYSFQLNGSGAGVPSVTVPMAVTIQARQGALIAPPLKARGAVTAAYPPPPGRGSFTGHPYTDRMRHR